MKSVLLSIKPKYCELIANGRKTVEIRKNRPKIDTPFKCYIYCTKETELWVAVKNGQALEQCDGKVIGEFVCDDIDEIAVFDDILYCVNNTQANKLKQACLTIEDIKIYLGINSGYAWHISNLVIYDKPRELSKFNRVCAEWGKSDFTNKCRKCPEYYVDYRDCSRECLAYGKIRLERPPQGWCYVEEVKPCKD